jgi:UDP-N-acetylmuramoyl-tripeptide--D-alanyl-D-alanine ligase
VFRAGTRQVTSTAISWQFRANWMTEPLWRWPELCTALDLPVVDGPDVTGISIDSRTISPGDLFIALTGDPGPRFNPSERSERDGHDFIDGALQRGAAGVLSHDDAVRNCPELKVADTLDGLWALGRAARARLDCPVVGITGSSGKTTTKTLATAALGAFSTPGSLNNHLGVPLSLARTPRDVTAAIYEIGTNHPGEIGPLSDLVRPNVAVLLNVHPAHAEFFRDLEELREEKLSIISGLEGISILVVEDRISLAEVPEALQVILFGHSDEAYVQLLEIEDSQATYRIGDRTLNARVPGGGAHRALSLAAVLGVFEALERDPTPALELTDELIPRGRGNRLEAGGVTLIDDSYNANPASMRAAIESLSGEDGRRYALLGEMLELGDESADAHSRLADVCHQLDGVICVGGGMVPLVEALGGDAGLVWQSPDDSLLAELTQLLRTGDTLLVKGSNRVFWSRDFVARIEAALTS